MLDKENKVEKRIVTVGPVVWKAATGGTRRRAAKLGCDQP